MKSYLVKASGPGEGPLRRNTFIAKMFTDGCLNRNTPLQARSPVLAKTGGSVGSCELTSSQAMERKPAIAVVFHHIGPHHDARLNAAADRLTGIEPSPVSCATSR